MKKIQRQLIRTYCKAIADNITDPNIIKDILKTSKHICNDTEYTFILTYCIKKSFEECNKILNKPVNNPLNLK